MHCGPYLVKTLGRLFGWQDAEQKRPEKGVINTRPPGSLRTLYFKRRDNEQLLARIRGPSIPSAVKLDKLTIKDKRHFY